MLKRQVSNGPRCWPGRFSHWWQPLVRPSNKRIQERWWLVFASSIGCADWASTQTAGTESTERGCDVSVITFTYGLSHSGCQYY
jgi:hypothetical protein